MHFDLRQLEERDRYKLLASVIVPRPIALVTSVGSDGHINAAPFSFFNYLGSAPPIIAIAPGDRPDGTPKDTARNIQENSEFVVNLVNEAMAEAMNICGIDFPHGINELEAAGLTVLESTQVKVPRIAQSLVNLECRQHTTFHIGHNRIIIGEVLHLHIHDDLIDAETLNVHGEQLHHIARMHGRGWYARTTDLFDMPRLTYEEWQQRNE
jgi:flavin reductase (DIM6/NTAB) family NADH-FMN oxidoreductase RutF